MNHTEKLVYQRTIRYMRAASRSLNTDIKKNPNDVVYSKATIEMLRRLTNCNDWLKQRRIDPPSWYTTWNVSYDYSNECLVLTAPV